MTTARKPSLQPGRAASWLVFTCCVIFPLLPYYVLSQNLPASRNSKTLPADSGTGNISPRQKYNLATALEAYEAVGHRDPRWDPQAFQALEKFALSRGHTFNTVAELIACQKSIADACKSAKSQGCRDPFIEHLFIRFSIMDDLGNSKYSHYDFLRTAQGLNDSRYPPIRKYLACLLTIERCHELRQDIPEIPGLITNAQKYIAEAVNDPLLPDLDAFAFCDMFVSVCKQSKLDVLDQWKTFEPVARKRFGDSPNYDLLKAHAYFHAAWQARGTRWASEVTPSQWKLMRERLQVAKTHAEHSWKANAKDWQSPNLMLGILQLDCGDPDEREVWFQRAMRNNTNNFAACQRKLDYLNPKWGGSAEALLAFGRECLTNRAWGGAIPQIMPLAHYEARLELDPEATGKYFQQPKVFEEGKAAFEELLRRDPTNMEYRREYARWTLICRGHEQAAKILPPGTD